MIINNMSKLLRILIKTNNIIIKINQDLINVKFNLYCIHLDFFNLILLIVFNRNLKRKLN